ncbi:MAG: hypothetical protein M1820_006119 [Bogoriella megaspora]|nr:MAG: hypothetical protein M1820_006119 [Bogoriella megaspora]
MSSWRLPSWSGRFSPFQRSTPTAEVKETDYEYVRPEDLMPEDLTTSISHSGGHHHSHSTSSSHHHRRERTPSPDRDTDALTLKSKKNAYTVHFAAHSISKGELRISDLKAQAAKKTGSSPKRIKLVYKGRNLKDDTRTCRDEGLRNLSEILCVVGDTSSSGLDDSDSDSNASGDEDLTSSIDGIGGTASGSGSGGGGGGAEKSKRKRHRKSKKKSKSKSKSHQISPQSTLDPNNLAPPPPRGPSPSRGASPSRAPQTPLEKLAALSATLGDLLDAAQAFLDDPPRDETKRDFEYKRLTETILAQVLLKLDGVETEGDERARGRRKELVKEAQGWLDRLDRGYKAMR